MTRVSSVMFLAVTVAAAAIVGATAKAQPPGGRRDMGGRQPMFRISNSALLRVEKVRTELKVTDEQAEKLSERPQDRPGGMRERFQQWRDLSEEARRKEMEKFRQQREKEEAERLASILSKKQLARLNNIRMQVMGFNALGTPEVVEKLNITPEQGKELTAIRDDMNQQRQKLFEGMRERPREERQTAMQELLKKAQGIQKKALDKAVQDVLTEAQRKTWKELTGEPFALEPGDLMRGRGPGGRQRPGAGEPGGRQRPGGGRRGGAGQ